MSNEKPMLKPLRPFDELRAGFGREAFVELCLQRRAVVNGPDAVRAPFYFGVAQNDTVVGQFAEIPFGIVPLVELRNPAKHLQVLNSK